MEENKCTLSNEELIARSEAWVHKLAETKGQAWTLRVPVDFNHDPDMLFCELCKRLKEATTPPTPLELEQLEEMVDGLIKQMGEDDKDGFVFSKRHGCKKCWNLIKPLISSMLQAKDERIKELEMRLSHKEKSISRWMSESDYCITQLQEKESEIAQLKKELEDKKAVG